jgi:hypothetical protein
MTKMSITKDQKITLYAAVIAFFISLLIGFVSGNSGAVALMRAIISSILFGAVVYGGIYLIRRYIPDLQSEAGEPAPAEKTGEAGKTVVEETGRVVDYTVSDAETSNLQKPAGSAMDEAAVRTAEEVSGGEGVGTVPAEEGGGLVAGMPAPESVSPVAEEGLEGLSMELSGDSGEEYEELPSLDNLFEDSDRSKTSDIDRPEKFSESSQKNTGAYIEVGDARLPNEPEALAKAVKKVMKQDEQ